MSVTKEDVGNDMRTITINDLVEEVSRLWQRIGSIPSCMFISLEILDQSRATYH